jgi:hypothetical protein
LPIGSKVYWPTEAPRCYGRIVMVREQHYVLVPECRPVHFHAWSPTTFDGLRIIEHHRVALDRRRL